MKDLNYSYRIRLDKKDLDLLCELKRLKIRPTTFIRIAFREKIEREMNQLLINEKKQLEKQFCPF